MDDRELEARLRTHLHRRFDDAQPARELASSVEQVIATQPRRVGLAGLGVRGPMRLGFSLTAAAVAVVVLAVAVSTLGLHLGPTSNGASPSPSVGPTERTFIVLPPTAAVPSKADSSAAADVLAARLRALGAGNFTISGGYGMTFTLLDRSGPTDDQIRTVLAAPGIVQFVRIPAGNPAVVDGQALPSAMPVLFGSEGIATVRDASDQNGNAALNINLTPAAAQVFADYTRNHIGEQFAIVLDGRVASAPIIQSEISGGSVQITNESSDAGLAIGAPIRAILIGGPLPEPWRGAPIVSLIPKSKAEEIALREAGTAAAVLSSDAQPLLLGIGRWTAVWNVVLAGEFAASCPSAGALGSTCGPTVGTELVVLDGATGGFIQSEAPAP